MSDESTAKRKPSGCLVALGALAAIIALSFLVAPKPTPEEQAQAKRDLQDTYMMGDARRAVTAHLRDPDSVRFGPMIVSRAEGEPVVCGSFNAKNGFGGYAGETPFMAGAEAIYLPDRTGRAAFMKRWRSACTPSQ